MSRFASKYNTPATKFEFDGSKLEFVSLSDLHDNGGTTAEYTIKGLFIKDGKFGKQGVAITPEFLVSLPKYLTETIEKMLTDEELIEAINNNKFGFKTRQYSTAEYKDLVSVIFIDLK